MKRKFSPGINSMEQRPKSSSYRKLQLSRARILACALASLGCPALCVRPVPANHQQNAAPADVPHVFSLPAAALAELRRDIVAGKVKATDPALAQVRKDADAALQQEPLSVTQKSLLPPSVDKHDYMSQAPYWWPDPAKPNGLPYIRRDGQTNPEIERIPDHKSLSHLISVTHALALCYYLLGDESCASHAAELLRVWFLDPQTRMNPSLEFAQGIPGHNTGRGTGLIETRDIYQLVDAVGLLGRSKSWSAADRQGMESWCSKFLDWMLESKNGKDEAAAKNNHGTYYDVQVASLALFTGREELARDILQNARQKRIASQIERDGKQPLELARTKALGYSTMNLDGLCELALLGEKVGVDLWNYQTADGRSIRKALDFLVPYVAGEKKWPYPQIVEYNAGEISTILIVAAEKYKDPHYRELALQIDPGVSRKVDTLLFR